MAIASPASPAGLIGNLALGGVRGAGRLALPAREKRCGRERVVQVVVVFVVVASAIERTRRPAAAFGIGATRRSIDRYLVSMAGFFRQIGGNVKMSRERGTIHQPVAAPSSLPLIGNRDRRAACFAALASARSRPCPTSTASASFPATIAG